MYNGSQKNFVSEDLVKKLVCNTPVLTMFALNVYDVHIVINHGVELQ